MRTVFLNADTTGAGPCQAVAGENMYRIVVQNRPRRPSAPISRYPVTNALKSSSVHVGSRNGSIASERSAWSFLMFSPSFFIVIAAAGSGAVPVSPLHWPGECFRRPKTEIDSHSSGLAERQGALRRTNCPSGCRNGEGHPPLTGPDKSRAYSNSPVGQQRDRSVAVDARYGSPPRSALARSSSRCALAPPSAPFSPCLFRGD